MDSVFSAENFKYSPFIPYDPTVNPCYTGYITHPCVGGVQPFEYTGWRDEMLSWHEACYIHAGLNPDMECIIKGPDALRLLSENLTNGFAKFDIGQIKHGIMCSDAGKIVMDGILLRLGEQEFEATNLGSILAFRLTQGDYDAQVLDVTGQTFLFQLGGPRSLDIVEAATGEDFHDLKFLRFRNSSINGMPVRIQRIGMAGSLAYEVHGATEYSVAVYEALIKAGEPFGLKKLGRHAYWNTHTENGFPQGIVHFPFAFETDKPLFEYFQTQVPGFMPMTLTFGRLKGSMGDENIDDRYVNPIELGWGKAVNFDHDFVGKAALQKIAQGPHRQVVTLEWNVDDILDVWKSEFGAEPYAPIDGPEDYDMTGHYEYLADRALIDGKYVGISSGRIMSWYYHKMLSLGFIDSECCEVGREVIIVWGEPGTRQKEIRATIARYPYMDEDRNESVNVSKL